MEAPKSFLQVRRPLCSESVRLKYLSRPVFCEWSGCARGAVRLRLFRPSQSTSELAHLNPDFLIDSLHPSASPCDQSGAKRCPSHPSTLIRPASVMEKTSRCLLSTPAATPQKDLYVQISP